MHERTRRSGTLPRFIFLNAAMPGHAWPSHLCLLPPRELRNPPSPPPPPPAPKNKFTTTTSHPHHHPSSPPNPPSFPGTLPGGPTPPDRSPNSCCSLELVAQPRFKRVNLLPSRLGGAVYRRVAPLYVLGRLRQLCCQQASLRQRPARCRRCCRRCKCRAACKGASTSDAAAAAATAAACRALPPAGCGRCAQ